MWQLWNGKPITGIVEGVVSSITHKAGRLEFQVDTDGVIRTILMDVDAAHIRISPEGITITEVLPDE